MIHRLTVLNLNRLAALAWSVLSICAEAQAADESFVIARNGSAVATIVVPSDATPGEKTAASELAHYLGKITGATFRTALHDNVRREKGAILIGRAGGIEGLETIAPEGFAIDIAGGNLRLRGKDDNGTEFAAYTLLEKYLGVRWYWPGELGEVVPRQRDIVLGNLRDVQEPDFKWRHMGPGGAVWGSTTGPTEMRARELVLGVTPEHQQQLRQWQRRNKWGGWKIYGGHSLGEIFPPEKYAKSHPEFYALVDGKRDVPGPNYNYKHGAQICTTNPEVVRTAAAWVNDFLDRNPEYDAVHVTLNDSSGYCECENCLALDAKLSPTTTARGLEEPEEAVLLKQGAKAAETALQKPGKKVITDRVFTYANQVSEIVRKKHPNKYVVMMAYMHYIEPPRTVRLNSNVIPQYCMWSVYKHADPRIRRDHERIGAGWGKAGADHVSMYEYLINGSWPGMHRLVVPYIADSIRFLKAHGYDLYETQAGSEFATNGINYYVVGKMLWDTSVDERKLLDDFYGKAFGRAGPSVRRFQERMQTAWTEATKDGTDIGCTRLETTRLLDLFTPRLLEDSRKDLEKAATEADDDLVRRRVAFLQDGLRYTELTADAVRAAQAVDFDRPQGQAAQIRAAIAAIKRQRAFVDEHKNDFVVPYFWARYSDEHRRNFLPLARFEALAQKIR